jgi:hypothetical protein
MTDPDAGLADRIAAALRQERQRELEASTNPPPPRPVAPVPDWLFGPRHRELDARRSQEREARRADEEDAPPEVLAPLADPSDLPPAVERCPWCNAVKAVEP